MVPVFPIVRFIALPSEFLSHVANNVGRKRNGSVYERIQKGQAKKRGGGSRCWPNDKSTMSGGSGKLRIKNDRTSCSLPADHDRSPGCQSLVMFASITNAARLAKQQRVIHTSSPGSNFIGDLTSALAQKQPCFIVSPTDVDVLSSPQQFYNTLLVCRILAHAHA